MRPDLQAKFLELNGYWIQREHIDEERSEGVLLKDGRFIKGAS